MNTSLLQLKVAGTMLAVALVAIGVTLLGLAGPMASTAMNRAVLLFDAIPDEALEGCLEDRVGWTFSNEQGLRAYAFDRQTNTTDNPAAPGISPLMTLRIFLGEREPLALLGTHEFEVGMIFDTHHPDTCETLFLVWPETENTRQGFFERIAFWMLAIGVVALIAGWRTTVQPILGSVLALDRSSRSVGQDGFSSSSGEVDASLQRVASALDDAHERILGEKRSLLAHQRALEEHLADVAHDLKTPIAALQLRLDDLVRRHDPDALRTALQDVAYLGLLTDNLGAAGKLRLESWMPELSDVDLGALIRRVSERSAALGSRRGIEVVYAVPDAPVIAQTSAVFAEQILANLVHNAVVHNTDGSHVAVVLERTDKGFSIEVADDGPGVANLEAMTERGVQLGGSVSGEGAGLGLAIVTGLSAKLGWNVEYDNAEPTGLIAKVIGRSGTASP